MGTDWYPGSRDAQIHLIKTWNAILPVKAQVWGVPQSHVTELSASEVAAQAILDKVQSGERTTADVAQCNTVFSDMEAEARFIKKHFLLKPPLAAADLRSLMLPVPDDTHSPVGIPEGQPLIAITYSGGPHLLTLRLSALPGTEAPDTRGDYGYALYKGVMPHGGATIEQAAGQKHYLMNEPLSGDDLLYFKFTRRKKETVEFDPAESGMTVFFCSRYENQKGQHGAWGAVASAVIP
ncbi:MAG: hypothetical protein LBC77_06885 [Spirochaetaceae bacterium]|jgi:hypothetical protein|nr:hypothetical protein [Spirochaetaceae bacterium]